MGEHQIQGSTHDIQNRKREQAKNTVRGYFRSTGSLNPSVYSGNKFSGDVGKHKLGHSFQAP